MDPLVDVTVHRAPWVLPIAAVPIPDGEVAVQAGRVVAVGRDLVGSSYVDHGAVLMPGLVNAHTHLQYGPAFADLATSGLPFPDWIAEVARRRAAMTDDDWFVEVKKSAAQALSTGTTAVADIVDNPVPAAGRAPLRGISYLELVGIDAERWEGREKPRTLDALAQLARIGTVGISPHSPYTVSTGVYAELVALARSQGLRLHPHVAESEAEIEFVAHGTGALRAMLDRFGLRMELDGRGCGMTPIGYVESIGGLGPDVHIAHGIHVDARDRERLRRHGTTVALCTRSNRILRAGAAPVAAYRKDGNPVAVGTDSLSSSPDLDLLAELRALRDLAIAQGTERDGLDAWLVGAATAGGATALGQGGAFGVLAPGSRADLVVVQGEPHADPYTTVVEGRAHATYLAGEKVSG